MDTSPAARVATRGCEATAWACTRDADGHCDLVSILCLAPQGTGPEQSMTVTVGLRASTLSNAFTYDLPAANGVAPPNGPSLGHFSRKLYP